MRSLRESIPDRRRGVEGIGIVLEERELLRHFPPVRFLNRDHLRQWPSPNATGTETGKDIRAGHSKRDHIGAWQTRACSGPARAVVGRMAKSAGPHANEETLSGDGKTGQIAAHWNCARSTPARPVVGGEKHIIDPCSGNEIGSTRPRPVGSDGKSDDIETAQTFVRRGPMATGVGGDKDAATHSSGKEHRAACPVSGG